MFDRGLAYGGRLDIPAGTAVRFEPGDSKTVTLVEIGGKKVITGGNGVATGPYNIDRREEIVEKLVEKGFGHITDTESTPIAGARTTLSRESYLSMFGPTTGDRVRLGDTELWVEVESDMVCQW